MTSRDFTNWLKGYLESIKINSNDNYISINFLDEKIKEVKDEETIKYIMGVDPYKEEKVPYHTICSCNPNNGGSGICGCTIANEMVDKNIKHFIVTGETLNQNFTSK